MSILEVLIAAVLLLVLSIPLITLVGSANRIGYSADRMLAATLHAQVILDALGQLEAGEMPLGVAGETVLFDEGSGLVPGDNGRWAEVEAFFALDPPFAMERRVVAERLPTGDVVLTVEIGWRAQPDQPATRMVELSSLAFPPVWN